MTTVVADPLARLRLTGFAGAVALAVGAFVGGVWPKPDPARDLPVLGALRHLAYAGGIPVAIAGMALLVWAWWRAGPLRPPVRWTVVTVALWALPLALAPPLFSRDVYSYAAQGEVFDHGLDPYTHGPSALPSRWLGSVSLTWRDTPAPYGPLFLALARLAVTLSGGHLVVAILLLRLVAVAGVVLVAVYLPVLARRCGVDERAAVWLGLASPLLLVHLVSGAHNDAMLVGLLVAGLASAVRGRFLLATVLVTLAAAVKVPAAVALPFVALLWARSAPDRDRDPVWRALAGTGVVAVGVFAAVSVLSGLGLGWVAALSTPGTTIQWTSLPTGLGMAVRWVLDAAGAGPGVGRAAITVTRTIGMALSVAVVAALWWRARRADEPRAVVAACGWSLAAVILLAPAFQAWYALWALVPLAASTVEDQVRRRLAVATVVLCFLILPDGLSLARLTPGPGVLLDLALLGAGTAYGVRRWRGTLPRDRPPARMDA